MYILYVLGVSRAYQMDFADILRRNIKNQSSISNQVQVLIDRDNDTLLC